MPVRGNAGTRLGKVTSGELDAVLLACAGLARIGRMDAVTQVFEPEEMLPAPGQGALAVECRDGDTALAELLSRVDDPVSRAAVTAERAVLAALRAGCSAPVGAYAAGTELLHVTAVIAAVDGESAVRASGSAPAAEAARLGGAVAADLLRQGAARLLAPGVSAAPAGAESAEAESSEHLSRGDDA